MINLSFSSEYFDTKIETMPINELKELQLKKLINITRHAYYLSPYYHKLMSDSGVAPEDIKSFDDFRKIPVFGKDDLRAEMAKTGDPHGGILGCSIEEVCNTFASTGTTGAPTFMAYTKNSREEMSEAMVRYLWMCKARPGMLTIFPGATFHWYMGFSMNALSYIPMRLILIGIIHPVTISLFYDAIQRFKPEYFIGGVLDILLALEDECSKRNVEPSEVLSCMEYIYSPAGEYITPETRKKIMKWGIKDLFETGGLGDGIEVIAECSEHNGMHCWMDKWYTELVDPESKEPLGPGERGEYLTTNLFSKGSMYVRFATEDFAEIIPEKCNCGRTHNRLRVFDRVSWILKVSNKNVTPTEIRLTLEKIPETSLGAFTVMKYDEKMASLKIKVAYNPEITKDLKELKERVESHLKEELGVDPEVELVKFEDLSFSFHKIQRVVDLTKEQA